ncbi:hypothetical protein [Pseudanabaena sp. FACHB-2040]|uniref:hypothetical protein n=1 Tax=Pseudanabaena sp. FACHB-2040 TaxID=2692859 RepID=UPI0016891627|nr:hypothetical protein [Pseudanabaena sp. FACHB-2040]MBD2261241.1 hypothetical protein [Pseudanabaena sp. FACHB-2040]
MTQQTGKFGIGKVLKQAREPDSQEAIKPDNQTSQQPENQILEPSIDQKATKPDSQIYGKPDIRKPIKQEEKQVNLCVKVPESHRRHWAAMAKLQGITMTDVMVEALTQKFGLPDNQK